MRRFRDELAVHRRILADPRTPRLAKWLLGLAIAYLLSPVDLIPDFIPVLGHLDDVLIVPLLVFLAVKLVPKEIVAEHRRSVHDLSRCLPKPVPTRDTMTIRNATADDAARICALYNPYILSTTVTFEEAPVPVDEMRRRIQDVTLYLPWLLLEDGEDLVGYAYATKWRARAAYRHSVESTIYLDQSRTGRGHGTFLYAELIAELRRRGLRTVIGGIAQPNPASVALHEKLGFRKVAHFEKVGFKLGQWLDVAYWQLQL